MFRSCVVVVLLGLFSGCQSPERAALQPLPKDAPVPPFPELVERAEKQVWAAHQFFYRDNWLDVEQSAAALNETTALFAKIKAEELPAKQKDALPKATKELTEASAALREAAKAKDATKTTQAFQRLHLAMKQLQGN